MSNYYQCIHIGQICNCKTLLMKQSRLLHFLVANFSHVLCSAKVFYKSAHPVILSIYILYILQKIIVISAFLYCLVILIFFKRQRLLKACLNILFHTKVPPDMSRQEISSIFSLLLFLHFLLLLLLLFYSLILYLSLSLSPSSYLFIFL